MPDEAKFLSVADVSQITDKIRFRQENFTESLEMSVGVVLMNYGDPYVRVRCVNEEWEGRKADLEKRDGVPLCPNGHPLFEITTAPRLALIYGE